MAANNLQKNYGHLTLRQLNMWQSTCVRCDFAHQLDQRGYGSLQPFLLFKIFVSPQNSWCSSLFMDIHPPNRRNRSSKSMIFLNMFNVLKTASHPHLHNSQHFTVHPQMSVWTSGFLVCWKVFTWIYSAMEEWKLMLKLRPHWIRPFVASHVSFSSIRAWADGCSSPLCMANAGCSSLPVATNKTVSSVSNKLDEQFKFIPEGWKKIPETDMLKIG